MSEESKTPKELNYHLIPYALGLSAISVWLLPDTLLVAIFTYLLLDNPHSERLLALTKEKWNVYLQKKKEEYEIVGEKKSRGWFNKLW
jgi:hypothetical protein